MLSVIDIKLWLSAVVETEVTVGAVVSVVELSVVVVEVVEEPPSLLLPQEMSGSVMHFQQFYQMRIIRITL